MIRHVVLFQPRAPLSSAERQALLDAVTAAARQCPTVRGCTIGRRVRHGRPGYEQMMRADYEFALFLDFDDLSGLQAYLAHPAHRMAGEYFTSASSSALAYDYAVADLDDAARLA